MISENRQLVGQNEWAVLTLPDLFGALRRGRKSAR